MNYKKWKDIITFSSSEAVVFGKRNALKLGDFGHVVGGGLRIICSWTSGKVSGSASKSDKNSCKNI